ncbi:baculoviral IAP repeat-containing protein 7 isoform X2 [Sphaerodactylus townsendi]|uniref:baculoviral IAP repeat-containing protein 7 isoform X2 n=1 Tax=Sphaerodactylus townsendi TaxID=933632 RepID=UPI002026D329|nr:baculoviral IAP repeat-containing protein 7 isoform X2 [Sphaerodactylus townsendi]
MQAGSMRDCLIAKGTEVVVRVLTNLLAKSLEMGDSSSPEDARDRHPHLAGFRMSSEEMRLASFQGWPDGAALSPAVLAAAGFFFVGPDDRVECFCCGGVLYEWLPEDDPLAEHKKFFPRCSFIRGKSVGRRRALLGQELLDCVDGQFLGMLQSLGVDEVLLDNPPEYPDMETESDRLATFGTWPFYAQVSPEILARAGFFYTGDGDYVRCFHCDGALRNWERGDDPWMEHAKWFPRCKFLLQSRGPEFVHSVQESYLSSLASSEDPSNQAGRDSTSSEEPARREPEPRRQVEEPKSPSEGESASNVEDQLRRLREERICKVCMDKDVSIVLIPCGHLVVCAECAPNLRRCPICRGAIRETVRAFMS